MNSAYKILIIINMKIQCKNNYTYNKLKLSNIITIQISMSIFHNVWFDYLKYMYSQQIHIVYIFNAQVHFAKYPVLYPARAHGHSYRPQRVHWYSLNAVNDGQVLVRLSFTMEIIKRWVFSAGCLKCGPLLWRPSLFLFHFIWGWDL